MRSPSLRYGELAVLRATSGIGYFSVGAGTRMALRAPSFIAILAVTSWILLAECLDDIYEVGIRLEKNQCGPHDVTFAWADGMLRAQKDVKFAEFLLFSWINVNIDFPCPYGGFGRPSRCRRGGDPLRDRGRGSCNGAAFCTLAGS